MDAGGEDVTQTHAQFSGPPPCIDGGACVHGRSAVASCTLCVAACPTGALALGEDALCIDEAACIGCTLCRPVCPERAITFPATRFDPLAGHKGSAALVACRRTAQSGRGVVPCIHGLSDDDLDALWQAGVTTLAVAHADCTRCTCAPRHTLALRVARGNLFHVARGAGPLSLHRVDESAWHARQGAALRSGHDVDHGRRALLSAMLGASAHHRGTPADPGTAIARNVPVIDEDACVACDACARICPHGALALSALGGALAYTVDAHACTGCRLCVDVCEDHAVEVREMQVPVITRVALAACRCKRCGTPFHVTLRKGREGHSQCRICARKPGGTGLFQVRE